MGKRKAIDKEYRDILRIEMEEYELKIGELTPDERKELRKWVKAGNSVYDNPYCFSSEDGGPMDYIEAGRIAKDIERNLDDCSTTSWLELYTDAEGDELPF